jgi:Bifunctional DNA primase/polymerase, N-terminal
MNALEKAIRLAERGLPVFFCGRSKRPTMEGGFHNATTNIETLRLHYEKAGGDLIGVPCGGKFVVIDPDLQHRAARQWLKANKDRIPVTRTHRTASGGLHFLFKPHSEFRHGVTVNDNVDTRGDGGYVIWWPAEGLPIYNANVIAEVPDWLIEAMPPAMPREERGLTIVNHATPIGAYLANADADGIRSPEAAFAGILRTMASSRQGERQSVCFWCANRTFELIRDGGLDHADAVATLVDVAATAGLSPHRVNEVIRRVEKAVLA